MSEKKTAAKDNQAQKKRKAAQERVRVESSPTEMLAEKVGVRLGLPNHPATLPIRQAQILQMQRTHGNAFVQR
jgi:hypothetical protein